LLLIISTIVIKRIIDQIRGRRNLFDHQGMKLPNCFRFLLEIDERLVREVCSICGMVKKVWKLLVRNTLNENTKGAKIEM